MSLGSYLNDEGEVYESPEKRVGSDKLLGLPTPNGKSIYFLTPKDKICDQYNVHWRYVLPSTLLSDFSVPIDMKIT